MQMLSLVIFCLLYLFSPCVAYLSSAAQHNIKIEPMVVAKTQITTLATSFIWQSVSLFILPYIAAATVSASFYGVYPRGVPYSYNELNGNFRQKIQTAKRITQVGIYSSPVENSSLPHKISLPLGVEIDFSHHQIIFQVDHLLWMLVSFGIDGLEVGAALSKHYLADRRRMNTLVTHMTVDLPTKKLKDFLKQHEGHQYDILLWNCQDFVQDAWDALFQ